MCSIGLAPNKLLAKIASDLDKPDGFCVLTPERMLEAVGDRPASLIPGVGPKTFERLRRVGHQDRRGPGGRVRRGARRAARLGAELRDRARGIDNRRVQTERERKSESCETTFAAGRLRPRRAARDARPPGRAACARACSAGGYRGRTVTLKIRLRPFRTYTRSRTLEAPDRGCADGRAPSRTSCSAASRSTRRCGCWAWACRGWSAQAGERRNPRGACSRPAGVGRN